MINNYIHLKQYKNSTLCITGKLKYHHQSITRTFPLSCGNERLEVRHGAERRVDLRVVRYVVAEIHHRRSVDRTEPDRLYPEVLKVIQWILDT